MPATENLKFEVELKMSGSSDFIKQLKSQLEDVNTAVKTVENSLNKGLGVSLDDLINKAKQLSNTLSGIDSSKSGNGSGSSLGVTMDFTPLITVLNRIETQFNSSIQSVSSNLHQSVQNSASVLEQVRLIRTKLYEIGSKFGVSPVSAGTVSPNAIPVNPGSAINVTCKCTCGGSTPPGGPNPPAGPPPSGGNPPQNNGLEQIAGYSAAISAAISAIGVYSAYAYDKTVDLKESLYAVTLSASQTQAALETVSQQQIVSGYTTDQLKDATILLERMGASAKRYLPIAVNVAQKTGNKLAVVAEDLAGALDSLEALEAFQSKYKISDSDLKRNGANFNNGKLEYTTSSDREAAGEALSKTLEQTFSSYNNVNTYGEAVNKLQNSIEALAAKVGEQFLPVFIQITTLAEDLINKIEKIDPIFIGIVGGTTAAVGALSGLVSVTSTIKTLIPLITTAFSGFAATLGATGGPIFACIAALTLFYGVIQGIDSAIEQQLIKLQEKLKQESDAYINLSRAAREYREEQDKIIANNKNLKPHQVRGEQLAKDQTEFDKIKSNIQSEDNVITNELKKYEDKGVRSIEDLYFYMNFLQKQVITARGKKEELKKLENQYKYTKLYSVYHGARRGAEFEENQLYGEWFNAKISRRVIKDAAAQKEEWGKDLSVATTLKDKFSVFEKSVDAMQKAVSAAEKNGGDRTGHYIRAIISEESLAPLKNLILDGYEERLRKPGETRSKAYENLNNPDFLSEMLFSLSKEGETDSPLFKELQMLLDLLKKRDSTYPKPEKKEKDLETVLRELKESRGWQSSEETKQKRSSFEAKDRIDPEKWKDLGKQLEQASRDNRAYLQTHKEDLEKFSQAMDAWADKQMDIWEIWAQAQFKGHDAAWAKTPEQRLDASKQTLHYYSELLKSHKDLLSQNEKLNARLTNAVKEQAEAFSQALQERFEKESASKTEDEILKAARRNLQTARSAKDLPEDMRDQEINKWKGQIQEALDSIKEKREQQQEQLRSMEAEKQNKQLEELEKRREKGEDVWPQMLALMRQMAAAEIEQVKLAEQKEIDALPEDLRDTQRELAEWHISQTRDKWQQQILEAYKRGNTKDTKDLDKRKKEIDQTTAAKNAKEDAAVKRERERLSRPTTFRSYDEIKQYKDNQRLEALQKKADERKAKNTEQANAEKQRLEEEARQRELESEKALTASLGSTVNNSTTSSTLQNFYIDGSKSAGDPDLRSLADSVSKILERRDRRQRAYSGMW